MSAVIERHDVLPASHPSGVPALALRAFAVLRLLIAFEFLWAFLDKTFGLGRATPAERAWVGGGSPTSGYLGGVEGPFAGLFGSMAGNVFYDWLFMVGLLGIGTALALGIGMRVAAVTGTLLLAMMWMASLPIDTNPFLDDHVITATALVALAAVSAGDTWGLGRWWSSLPLVARYPVLR